MTETIRRRRAGSFAAWTAVAVVLVGAASAFAQAPQGGQWTAARQAYPTGDVATSVILLERIMPVEVRAGDSFEYVLKLSNVTGKRITDLVLNEMLPDGMSVSDITPAPQSREGQSATWRFEDLGPRSAVEIRVTGSAQSVGELSSCATVTFQTHMCSGMRIVQPALELVKTAPAEVLLCDPIPLQFVVSNPGDGVARNVSVVDHLPEGWTSTDGRDELVFVVGDLGPRESKQFTAQVRASGPGHYTNQATATEAGGLSAQSSASTTVVAPVLTLVKNCPGMRFLGREAMFELTVRNDGDGVARDVVLTDMLPSSLTAIRATEGGQLSNGQLTWRLGSIAPGESRTVQIAGKVTTVGTVRNTARVAGYCAEAEADCAVEVQGIPAILLEVVDIEDPIEVGTDVTYEIKVTNQGSAVGTNIVIACELPSQQRLVSADGPTASSSSGQQVVFAPLPSLAPRAVATYRVRASGIEAGDLRFKVNMTSDQLTEPVTETESTHVY